MHQEVTRFKKRYKLPLRSQKIAKVLVFFVRCLFSVDCGSHMFKLSGSWLLKPCLIKIIDRSFNLLKNVYNLPIFIFFGQMRTFITYHLIIITCANIFVTFWIFETYVFNGKFVSFFRPCNFSLIVCSLALKYLLLLPISSNFLKILNFFFNCGSLYHFLNLVTYIYNFITFHKIFIIFAYI